MVRQVWIPGVSGPLAGHAAGYRSWLEEQSYSGSSISDRLWQFAQLSRWLEDEGLSVAELTSAVGERFVASRRAVGQVTLVARQSMTLPLEYLRLIGAAPQPVMALLAEYATFLLVERGLSKHTVFDVYVPTARLFLAGLARGRRGGLRLDRLAAADVSVFVTRACQDRSVSGIRDLVSALRKSAPAGGAEPFNVPTYAVSATCLTSHVSTFAMARISDRYRSMAWPS